MKRLLFLLFLCFGLFGWAESSEAANYYVRSGGANGNGSDWANSDNTLPTTFTRGDTYYVAGGTYAGQTFNTAVNGTLPITIKGAIVTSHGTDIGWSDSYSVETTPAIWTSGITFGSSYWVFDGSVGSMTETASAYGFSFGTTLTSIFQVVDYTWSGASFNNFTISHIYAKALNGDYEKMFFSTHTQVGSVSNVTVDHCFLDGFQGGIAAHGSGTANNWIFENNLAYNMFSSSAHHGEWINASEYMTNPTIRYNIFKGTVGGTGIVVANNSNMTGAKVYGNIFDDTTVGNGIITGTSAGNLINAEVYNNTFLYNTMATGIAIGGQGSGNIAYNNLFYSMEAGISGSVTPDYNYYVDTTGQPNEAHSQVGTGDPFTDFANGDYRLKSDTNAGISLSAPYDVDRFGNAYSANGGWTRGAIAYTTGAADTTAPAAPNGLAVN